MESINGPNLGPFFVSMVGFILGEKQEQSQLFRQEGERIPVTFIKTSPCYLIDIKLLEKDRYIAIRLGFQKTKKINKPKLGTIKKAGIETPLRFLREFRLEKYGTDVKIIEEEGKQGIEIGEQKVFQGQELKPENFFKAGEKVDVSGTSIGKGFQGVVRRHRFAGGPKTHGQSDRERAPGSIGQSTTPGRVYKGKRMAGRMGGKRISVKNLEVVEVKEDGILIKGVVPGAKGGLLEIKSSRGNR